MRSIPAALKSRFESNLQTRDNNADPAVHVRISRPTTPLTNDAFIERSVAASGLSGLTRADAAVSRPVAALPPEKAYLAYVANGAAGVKSAPLTPDLSKTTWTQESFSEPAADVAICFDGRMIRQADGSTAFLTDPRPWVFWVDGSGKCKGRILGLLGDVTLAESNCTAVSAVRATQSAVAAYDFGLIVFLILNGSLFYRQLIAGVWYDAEQVSFGPMGAVWTDVAASRTADWRVVVQAKTSLGNVYELFTQYMGIGSKNAAEHLTLLGAASEHSLTGITRWNAKHGAEHLTLDVTSGPYRFAFEPGPVSFLGAWNEDDGTGDWGKRVVLRFSKELDPALVQANIEQIALTDANGTQFYTSGVEMDVTGKYMTLVYASVNNAVGDLTVNYVPGTIATLAGAVLGAFTQTFTPTGLVPVAGLPMVEAIYNDGDQQIVIKFSEALTGTLDASKWHVLAPKATPGGWIMTELTKQAVAWDGGTDRLRISLPPGNQDSLQGCGAPVRIRYTGATLNGQRGPLLGFAEDFTPTGVAYRGDQYLPEHLELTQTDAPITLTRVYYQDAKHGAEHLELTGIGASHTLTNIHDI